MGSVGDDEATEGGERESRADLVMQTHEVIRRKTDTGSEDVDDALSLSRKSIHHRGARGDHWGFQEIGKNGEDAVESFEMEFRHNVHKVRSRVRLRKLSAN
jgi:hypothetical protein